jgi:hypothetical protein
MAATTNGSRARASLLLRTLAAWLLFVALAASAQPGAPTGGHQRIALVIGNAAYRNAPLDNPVNDARDMTEALQRSGFAVVRLENASQRQMAEAIRAFGERIRDGGVGLFYFAGHGVQVKGRNFLLPVDEQIEREDELPYRAIDVGQVLDKMESAKNGTNLLILDACRNNPFPRAGRSVEVGLAPMQAPVGTLIAFATAPGAQAIDGGRERNGLYTHRLLGQMRQPGLKIEDVFKRVRSAVREDSGGRQVPWENTSLEGDFFFIPPPPGSPAPTPADAKAVELDFWNTVRNSGIRSDYLAYLERYPNGEFAKLARQRADQVPNSSAAPPRNSSPSPFSFSRAEQEAVRQHQAGAEAVARLASSPCPAERKRAPIRIEVSEYVNSELARHGGSPDASAGARAIAARLKGAGLNITESRSALYTLHGTISSQAGSNRLMLVNEIVITASLALVGRDGQRIANALVREEAFAGSDLISAYQELVDRQADEVAVRIHQGYCVR